MTPDQLAGLRPADHTAAAISAALGRIEDARADAISRRESAEAERSRYLTDGATPKQRAAIEAAIADTDFDLDQIAPIGAALRDQLDAAEAQERQAALDAEHAGLIADIGEHTAFLDAELPPIAEKLREIGRRENMLSGRAAAYAGTKPVPSVAGQWIIPSAPETCAERAAWLAAVKEKEAAQQQELQAIRYEQAEATRRRFEQHAAAEREREAGPRLDRAGAVDLTPNGPIVRLAGHAA